MRIPSRLRELCCYPARLEHRVASCTTSTGSVSPAQLEWLGLFPWDTASEAGSTRCCSQQGQGTRAQALAATWEGQQEGAGSLLAPADISPMSPQHSLLLQIFHRVQGCVSKRSPPATKEPSKPHFQGDHGPYVKAKCYY